MKKVLVIGGGASGMIAAITAARGGNEVTILERNEKLGTKILLTGNGRCNITNRNVTWKNYHGENPKFSASVLAQFSNDETIKFFEDLGLVLVEEDEGRLFPRSQQSQSVVDVLEQELERLGVKVLFNRKIKKVQCHVPGKRDQASTSCYPLPAICYPFTVTTYHKKQYKADTVIIATGGKTYPKTGSTGAGYQLAESLGHKIIKPFPVSAPFRIKSAVCNKLQGIKVNAQIKIFNKDKLISSKTDELLFTHLGLSAPAVLKTSREVSKAFRDNHGAQIICFINLFPEYSQDELHKLLKKRIETHPEKNIGNQFIGILPKKVAPTILRYSRINPERLSKQVSNKTLDKIVKLLTCYPLPVTGVLGWDIAQFTAGGVDVREIDSQTMESKIVPGLFFCGEVVDIDGDSGGYNLQWAWSSGYVAGKNVG